MILSFFLCCALTYCNQQKDKKSLEEIEKKNNMQRTQTRLASIFGGGATGESGKTIEGVHKVELKLLSAMIN